jgi:hypothetical protein
MIDTHEELVLGLSAAAELEHSLICQYLYAAYSIKTSADGTSVTDQAQFERWREAILSVARQEMGHLGTVWNLQTLVGASPCTDRANFPQLSGRYYPPEIDFSLTAFSIATLERFIAFEAPERPAFMELALGPPDPIVYARVGDLYRQLRSAFTALRPDQALVDPTTVQDSLSWSNNVTLKTATTQQQAVDAINFIIAQGEGAPGNMAGSHYATFVAIRDELQAHIASGGVAPQRAVMPNPWTASHPGVEGGGLVDEPSAVEAMSVFNLLYGTLLQLLRHYYAHSPITDDQRDNLKMAAFKIMHGCLAPLGELLTRLPAKAGAADPRAGPAFERFGHDDWSSGPGAVWKLGQDRLSTASAALSSLATTHGAEYAAIAATVDEAASWLSADQPV